MFSHVMLGANDVAASKTFYDATFGALGIPSGKYDDKGRVIYASDKGLFMLTTPINGEPASCANGGTIGFAASSPEAADQWYEAGLAHGGSVCADPPGIRDSSFGKLYLAYLRDPAGNKLCAMKAMGK